MTGAQHPDAFQFDDSLLFLPCLRWGFRVLGSDRRDSQAEE